MAYTLTFIVAVALTGCRLPAKQVCTSDAECGAGNVCCPDTHACASPDPKCKSGYRYNASAGPLGHSCMRPRP